MSDLAHPALKLLYEANVNLGNYLIAESTILAGSMLRLALEQVEDAIFLLRQEELRWTCRYKRERNERIDLGLEYSNSAAARRELDNLKNGGT